MEPILDQKQTLGSTFLYDYTLFKVEGEEKVAFKEDFIF